MKIGVISDTHGYLDPKVHDLFAGVEHILHGGDIGFASIILELEQIAPVTAVLGNNDYGMTFRETEVIELAGKKILVHHIVHPQRPAEAIQGRIERAKPDVVVFGHTHQPFNEVIGGCLFLNPGYAGKPRFKLERSVAILSCAPTGMTVEFAML
ncbi:MAG: metallophosphoesterase family protein [Verrucomicrobiota bacterium]